MLIGYFLVEVISRKRFPQNGPILLFGLLRVVYFHYDLAIRTRRAIKGEDMKKILFKKRIDFDKRMKTFSIYSQSEDKECKTRVRKGFAYTVEWAKGDRPVSKAPLVFIKKSLDTKKGVEGFSFHVKGHFYINHNRRLMRVRFNHTLDIEINWKVKNFSPKKSASLT